MNATLDELYQWANDLSLKHWGMEFDGVIELKSRRWRNTNGRFLGTHTDGVPLIIQMCKYRNAKRTEEEVKRTLLHELVHWRLFTCGIPHRDTNDEFIKEAIRVGASISKTAKAQRAYNAYLAKAGR